MLYFYMGEKMAEERIDAFIEETNRIRMAHRTNQKWTFQLPVPDLSKFFAILKSEKKTAVTTQA
jgi:hypothetical protein